MTRAGGIPRVRLHVEAVTLVLDVDDQLARVDGEADEDTLGRVLVVAAQDGVGECLAEGDRDVEGELPGVVRELGARMAHELDDALDVRDVARDLDDEGDET